jgi:hypothetical protein
MEKLNTCLICGHNELMNELLCTDFVASGENFNLQRCKECTFLFTNPRPDTNEIGKYYQSDKYVSHAGKKEGLIPGFIEGLDQMTYGDKAIIFIPSKLAYGERGAGGVIPPNTNIIFELEMIEVIPEVVKKTEEKSDVKTEEKK